MKKVTFTLLISAAFTASFAQTSKAIFTNGTYAEIGDFDPSNQTFSNKQTVGNVDAQPRDFIYDAKNGHVIYQDKTNGLVMSTISGNKIYPKVINLNSTVMAPAYIPSSEKVVFFKVHNQFNGYGSNEENLTFSTFNLKKGVSEDLISFKDLSFNNVAAPFFGKIKVISRFNHGDEIEKEVAISKPIYIAEKDLYMVMVKDVTGTNRLYKIKVSAKNANVASNRCDYNIIDMTHVAGTNIVKTLFFEKSGSTYQLMVGDLDITTNAMSKISLISTFTASEINNGSIKFNTDQSKLFVSRFDGVKTNISDININNNQVNTTDNFPGYVQYDFGFNESYYVTPTYAHTYGLYPNPSTGLVNFKNTTGLMPNSIMVYDNVGQLVRSIKVEELTPQISIDLTGMATGIYHVRVDMPKGEDFIGKVAITN